MRGKGDVVVARNAAVGGVPVSYPCVNDARDRRMTIFALLPSVDQTTTATTTGVANVYPE